MNWKNTDFILLVFWILLLGLNGFNLAVITIDILVGAVMAIWILLPITMILLSLQRIWYHSKRWQASPSDSKLL